MISRACPLFVPLAEEGWIDNDVARDVAEIYLADLRELSPVPEGTPLKTITVRRGVEATEAEVR